LYAQASKKYGAKNSHVQRLKKRVDLLSNELSEMKEGAAGAEEEAEEVKEAAPSRNAEELRSRLPAKQLKTLEILDKRLVEFQDACQWAMTHTKDKAICGDLLGKAENLKKKITSVENG